LCYGGRTEKEQRKQTSNAQRPTLNVQFSKPVPRSDVGRWALSVERLPRIAVFSRPIIWRVLDVIIGGLFIYAGVTKVLDPVGFANDIDNYKILPWPIGVRLAFCLPWLEIFCGLALIARRLYLGGLCILISLTSIFIVASIMAKIRGIDITCGCFGHASKDWSFSTHLGVDFAILAMLVFLMRSFFAAQNVRLGR
jgi:putative oxidoreductase